MAGHSKWSKVKRFKGAIDAKRGKIFSKLSKEITLAAKSSSPSPFQKEERAGVRRPFEIETAPHPNPLPVGRGERAYITSRLTGRLQPQGGVR